MGLEFQWPASLSSLGKFFKKSANTSIGVDIGSNSVKVIQLEKNNNQLFLKNYALAKVDCELISPGSSARLLNESAGKIVSKVFEKLGIKDRRINLAVPSFVSLITVINLEARNDKEAQKIIEMEAPKFIPMPLEDVIYDWQIIDSSPSVKKTQDDGENRISGTAVGEKPVVLTSSNKKVVLVAIMKEISRCYEEILSKNGFKVNSLEVDSFSLIRSLVGNDKNNYLILDIGGKVCNIIVVYQGNLVMNKSVNLAGYKLTGAIARALNVSNERAEEMKISQGNNAEAQQIREQVYDPFLKSIVDEIKKSVELFKQNHENATLEGIILSGGSSKLIGLEDYLKDELKMKVFVGNPWSKINYPPKVEKNLIKLGPSFSVAVGLAMLGLKED